MRSSKLAICEGEGQVSWNRLEVGLHSKEATGERCGLLLEEAGAKAAGNGLQVEQGEEIDGAEFAVDSRWAAEARGEVKVGAK